MSTVHRSPRRGLPLLAALSFLLGLAAALPVRPACADEAPPAVPPPAPEGPEAPEAPKAPEDPVLAVLLDPPETGLLVMSVLAGSPAAAAGVDAGAILLSYGGTALASPEGLRAAIQAAGAQGDVLLTWRAASGGVRTAPVPPGRLGVSLRSVVKGQGVAPLPSQTVPSLDTKGLAVAVGEAWYALRIKSAGTRGYEWQRATAGEDGAIHLEHEVAFDGGERWGRMHSLVRISIRGEGTDVQLTNGLDGTASELTIRAGPAGATELTFASVPPGGTRVSQALALPPGPVLVPSYLVGWLATRMPAEAGASFWYRPVSEGNGQVGLPSALTVVRREPVDVAGVSKEAWRVEATGLGASESSVFWVEGGRVLKADYGDAVTTLATKEEALRDVAEDLRPAAR